MIKEGYRSGILAAGIGLALLAGATSRAFAMAAVPGNLNLRTEGYELLTPTGGSPEKVDIQGIGQLIADSGGNFAGAETFTSVNSTAATEDVCTGSVAGTIVAPAGGFASGTGEFTINLTYTPSSTGASCIPSTTTMSCSRALFRLANVNNLAAGEYRCVATGMTAGSGAAAAVNGVSLRAHLGSSRGANAPTN